MDWLKRNYKAVVGGLVILILLEIVLAWYMIEQFRANYLSADEAVGIALEDASLTREEAKEPRVKLETKQGKAWYTVELELVDAVHQYKVDAGTGEILSRTVA